MKPSMKPKSVRIYPLPGVSLVGFRAIEQEVSLTVWEALQKYTPPPFTDKPPGAPAPSVKPTEPKGSSDIGGSE